MREDAYLEVDRIHDVVRAAPHTEECDFAEPDPRSYIGAGVTGQPRLPCTCWNRDAFDPRAAAHRRVVYPRLREARPP
jgi:hypothetical protein